LPSSARKHIQPLDPLLTGSFFWLRHWNFLIVNWC
jgi:hypothetical protein